MSSSDSLSFLDGGGDMGARMRAFDWSRTGLGAPGAWPQSLKTVIRIMLDSRFAMWMCWGPALNFFCNDAYAPTLGIKREWALGERSDKVWEEIWHDIGPRIRHVLTAGEATYDEGLQLFLRRSGYQEETFHTFSYSPVRDDASRVAGMLCVVVETTEQVIGARRVALLRDLAACPTPEARSLEDAGRAMLDSCGSDPLDLPFVALYLAQEEAPARLAGLRAAGAQVPAPQALALAESLATRVDAAGRHAHERIELDAGLGVHGVWPEPLRQAVLFPLRLGGQLRPLGALVLAGSTRRELDDGYLGFLALVADQFASQLADTQTRLDAQRRADALAELDRAKNIFFSNASHEFRTPLTLMLGPIDQLLGRTDLPEPARRELELARRNGQRLRKLVNSLLDFSRIEAGRVEARYQRTDLAAYTAELAAVFRSAVEDAGLRLEVDVGEAPLFVDVDRDMWEKVVLNLLSNAFKFTFEGAIEVGLHEREGQACLVVRDSGVGIDAAELPRVFERFHRVAGARSRSQEGSGIGLALVKELVKLHGGTIRADSRPGAGSEFVVCVPLGRAHLPAPGIAAAAPEIAADRQSYVDDARRAAATPAAPAAPAEAPAAEAGAAHILVVDDNADMRAYVQRLLQSRWQVSVAADGKAALEAVARERPDLVVTDMMMPGLDGRGLIARIRADAATRALPVIVLSAQAGEEARVAGLNQGADDYLVKPFAAAELLARVDAQLMRARLRRAEDLANERLADVFRAAPVGVALLRGPGHVYEFVNANYVRIVGGRELLGRPIREALPELEGQGIYELLDHVYESGETYNGHAYPVQMLDPASGRLQQRHFEFVYQPVPEDSAHPRGIAVVSVEVTELMAARHAAETASRAKDEFIAVLGHELRNPLAPIATALQLMKLRHGGVAGAERAIIERQVKHMTRLIDDLLDVSRIARGNLSLRKEPVELAAVVDKAVETAGPLVERQSHTLSLQVPREGLPVMADATRLSQVVSNLLTNAAKFSDAGTTIRVRAWATPRDGAAAPEVVLEVQDHGAGMTPDELGSIFELFVQGRQGIDRRQGGLGLGLTIARNLARLHGGSLQARSDGPGTGSTFTLRLPLLQAAVGGARSGTDEPVRLTGARRRVLVVDDIEDVALSMRELLSELGHDVLMAFDGPGALKLLAAQGPVDVALLDIGLPVMDGYELARHLRHAEGGDRLRLVALSGYGQHTDRQKSRAHGFDMHLVKPVRFAELVEALGTARPRG